MSLKSVINNFIDCLMETYGHNGMNDELLDEIMNFRNYMCTVLCKLIEK